METALWIAVVVLALAVVVMSWCLLRSSDGDDSGAEALASVDTYSRWLEAGRPPFDWFVRLSPEEQLALATIGNGYVQNVAVGLASAIQNPAAAAAGLDPGKRENEVALVEQLAMAAAQRIAGKAGRTPPAASMGGLAQRQEVAQVARQEAKDAGRSFLGRRPAAEDDGA